LTYVLRFNRGNGRRFAQVSFALLAFARKYVLFVAFVAFDLACSGDAKSFRCGSVGFDFRHFLLL
jgi:hypothetical protein